MGAGNEASGPDSDVRRASSEELSKGFDILEVGAVATNSTDSTCSQGVADRRLWIRRHETMTEGPEDVFSTRAR